MKGKMNVVRRQERPVEELSAWSRNLSGQKFGRWTVLDRFMSVGELGKSYIIWKCKCDCGNIGWVRAGNLTHGISTSCGCYRKEVLQCVRSSK